MTRNIDHFIVIEVEAGDSISGFGLLWFFLKAYGTKLIVKLYDAIPFWILNGVSERLWHLFFSCGHFVVVL